ncbi:hypothetical protein MCEMRE22_01028 [Candidatus Nanopelagicaceae bacterium]
MEILRFEDQGPSAPHRKKSSRGFLIVGLIATLFGISSAFASSTITINGTNAVNLGQGVVTVSGCDSSIGFKPITKLSDSATAFQVTDFVVGYDFDGSGIGLIDTDSCDMKQMKITLYKDRVGGVDLVPCQNTYNDLTIPRVSTGGNSLKGAKVGIGKNGTANGNFAEYVTDYKCSSDGSFYFLLDKTRGSQSGSSMRIHWYDQSGFVLNANTFDHITIESVSGETGLSGV